MTRYNSILLIAPLLFAFYWLMSLITIHQKEITTFNSWVLQKQVNYAADAAVEELRQYSENSNMDYINETINVDTSYAIDEFESVLCQELGYEPSDIAKDMVGRNYIKVLLLCTEQGFYPYMWTPVRYAKVGQTDPVEIDLSEPEAAIDNTHTGVRKQIEPTDDLAKVSEFISYPMMPYSGYFNHNLLPSGTKDYNLLKEGQKYAVTLACDKIYQCEYADNGLGGSEVIQGVSIIKDENGEVLKPEAGTVLQMRGVINRSVETFLRSAIYSTYGNEQPSTVVLPAGIDTIHGGNGIQGPCVLALVDTSKQKDLYNAAFGIGGATIQETDYVLAWTEPSADGHKWWVTTSMLRHAGYTIENNEIKKVDGSEIPPEELKELQGIENARIYNSPFKAADSGYNEYWYIMGAQKWLEE